MFSASRHRQVKRNAPRILLISNESIAASGSSQAGNSSESGAGAALDGATHSRFAGALATRITPSGAERNEPGKAGNFHDFRRADPDPGPHGLDAAAGQAAR